MPFLNISKFLFFLNPVEPQSDYLPLSFFAAKTFVPFTLKKLQVFYAVSLESSCRLHKLLNILLPIMRLRTSTCPLEWEDQKLLDAVTTKKPVGTLESNRYPKQNQNN